MRRQNKPWIARASLVSAFAVWAGQANALPAQDVFTAAGLGSASNWTLVASPSEWGTGGNGYFASGGSATLVLSQSDTWHTFGTVGLNNSFGANVVFRNYVNPLGQTLAWAPVTNPFAFAFQNNASPDADFVTSDGVLQGVGLDIAIYQDELNPNRFALFYDDGGGKIGNTADDNDYDDMVVTVTQAAPAAVPEPGTLAVFGAALVALALGRRRLRRA